MYDRKVCELLALSTFHPLSSFNILQQHPGEWLNVIGDDCVRTSTNIISAHAHISCTEMCTGHWFTDPIVMVETRLRTIPRLGIKGYQTVPEAISAFIQHSIFGQLCQSFHCPILIPSLVVLWQWEAHGTGILGREEKSSSAVGWTVETAHIIVVFSPTGEFIS